MASCFVYYGSGLFHSGFDLRVTVIQMVGCGDFLASSGLWWNLRCAHHVRNRSASLCDAFQSFSSHHLSASSEVKGISSYPQRRSLVGDLVQWMQILASSGMSSAPSGGQTAICTSSPSLANFPATVWEFFPCICADYAVVSEHADIESVPIAVIGNHGLPDWQAAVFVGQWWRRVAQASDDVRVHP